MAGSKDTPGVIAPPPLIFLGFVLLGWALERYVLTDLSLGLPDMVRRWGAVILVVAGFALEAAAAERFRAKRTAVEPWKPTTALATDGIYRLTRNPIYLGFTVIYVGLALGMDSPVAMGLILPCLIVIDRFVIAREERYLEAKFGQAYRDYKARVRRWL